MMMKMTANVVASPPTGPISSRGDLRERPAVSPHRRGEHHHVVHRARRGRADEDPEEAGQVAELRRQHGADERSRAGDRSEVVAEEHPFVRRIVIDPIPEPQRGGAIAPVEREHLCGKKGAVEPVHEDIEAARGGDDPERIYFFGGIEQTHHDRDGNGCDKRKNNPEDFNQGLLGPDLSEKETRKEDMDKIWYFNG